MSLNFKEDATSASMTVLGTVLIVAGLVFMTVIKKPTPPNMADVATQKAKVQQSIDAALKSKASSDAYIAKESWQGSDQDVSPAVLDRATKLAQKHGLTWVALRPQRIDQKISPPQLPYTAIVNGPFSAVADYTRDLESEENKIAVSSVMITSADPSSDKVTATIGLVAYLDPNMAPAAAPSGKTATTQEGKHA